jgi:hypothetical protein
MEYGSKEDQELADLTKKIFGQIGSCLGMLLMPAAYQTHTGDVRPAWEKLGDMVIELLYKSK